MSREECYVSTFKPFIIQLFIIYRTVLFPAIIFVTQTKRMYSQNRLYPRFDDVLFTKDLI